MIILRNNKGWIKQHQGGDKQNRVNEMLICTLKKMINRNIKGMVKPRNDKLAISLTNTSGGSQNCIKLFIKEE